MNRVRCIVASAFVLPLACLPSCAWSNVDNRPVWNAFEQSLVPDGGGWFVATLPVTVPLGLLAIATDTVIAHPLQVLDDAASDAGELWRPEDFEFEQAYYTEMAGLPIRSLVTPVVFVGSFAGRVLFDIRAPKKPLSDAERLAESQRRDERQQVAMRNAFLGWLQSPGDSDGAASVPEWHPSFDEPMLAALHADVARRIILHTSMLRGRMTKIGTYDAELGLRDEDPVVRYVCIKHWPDNHDKPSAELIAALCQDPVASVRLLANKRFAR